MTDNPISLFLSPFLGNKCDLEQERQVPFQKACDLANERGILAALETSAKVTLMRKYKPCLAETGWSC